MKTIAVLLLLLPAACAAPPPPEASVKPGVNKEFQQPDLDPAKWVERFEREGREVYVERERIVAAAGLRPGMAVADVGAGTGLFVPLLARAVGPSGSVVAVDIVPRFLDLIARRASETGLRNVRTVLCTDRSAELPAGSVDLVFLCDTYHHFEFPKSTLSSLRRALRPGGELLVVDFKRLPGRSSAWILDHVRAGEEEVVAEIEAAGFRRSGSHDFLKDNYILRFRRTEGD
jgi:ubiquinone/menaquinone biosynthesis C-methylase UbiE